MKTIELEKFIQHLGPELYSFAFVLIPDDLQATQLMIDSVSAFMIQKRNLIDKWVNGNQENAIEFTKEVRVHLYKLMHELSRKRYNQLRLSFKNVEDKSGFFSLDFDDKSALFLRERTDFNMELIEFIVGKSHNEVLGHLYSARLKMVANLPPETITKDV